MSGHQTEVPDPLTVDTDHLRSDIETVTQGDLTVSERQAHVGEELLLEGRNVPADDEVEIFWHTYSGGWELKDHHEVIGPRFEPDIERIGRFSTTSDGAVRQRVTVPEDYGGRHVYEMRYNGDPLDTATVTVVPSFELEEPSVPLGGECTIRGYGLGPDPVTSNYQVTWDNGMAGYVTGVENDGTMTATIRAVGPIGPHSVSIWRNTRGVPYLQTETQSGMTPMDDGYGPVAGGSQRSWTVEVTKPESRPPTMWMDPLPDQTPVADHMPAIDRETEAQLEITPRSGTAGTSATITGENFPPDEHVDLIWYRHEGHFAQGIPVAPEPKPEVLPTVTADSDGRFEVSFEIPDDKGATRPITAEIGRESVAMTAFMIQPSIVDMSPKRGPVGTDIEIEISGLGWPIYEMAPYFTYDNTMMGYICSEDDHREHGISRPIIQATGEPGLHFIDVYPSIFETVQTVANYDISPNLSYRNNHPGRRLPGIHFTFEVTE